MKLTGVPIVLNTSFNKQEPIVARPEEAISCFLRTEMDVLVLATSTRVAVPPQPSPAGRDAFTFLEANTRGGE